MVTDAILYLFYFILVYIKIVLYFFLPSCKATEYDLFEFFKQYGKVKDAKIIVDKNSGKPKGYACVCMCVCVCVCRILENIFGIIELHCYVHI